MTELSNTALDLLFEPRGATTKIADTSLRTSGVDISNRYMDKSLGQGATAAVTNLRSNGADINTLFTVLGDVVVSLPAILWGGLGSLTYSVTAAIASASLTLNSDGTTSNSGGAAAGNWLATTGGGDGGSFECKYQSLIGDSIIGPSVFTSLAADATFNLVNAEGGGSFKSATFTVVIRETGDAGTEENRTVTLNATSTGIPP